MDGSQGTGTIRSAVKPSAHVIQSTGTVRSPVPSTDGSQSTGTVRSALRFPQVDLAREKKSDVLYGSNTSNKVLERENLRTSTSDNVYDEAAPKFSFQKEAENMHDDQSIENPSEDVGFHPSIL